MRDIQDLYSNKGYIIEKALFDSDKIETLKSEILSIYKGERGYIKGMNDINNDLNDEEILKSIHGIYNSHKISDLIFSYISHTSITEILKKIIGPNVKCMQSMIFTKPPGTPGQAWHQDEVPIPTRDKSLCGCWIALDDVDKSNGCLWVLSGSNKKGILYERRKHEDPEFDRVDMAFGFNESEYESIPVVMKPGSVVFFNGYLLHRSSKNITKNRFRRALVFHYMSAESWLGFRGTADYRDVVMACGKDPYEYKGYTNENLPAVRFPTDKIY